MNFVKFSFYLVILQGVIFGCSSTYNSLKINENGYIEILNISEDDFLGASYEAIIRVFPNVIIDRFFRDRKGFYWSYTPLLDKTNYELVILTVKGESLNGKNVKGISYSIRTNGTQALVFERFVKPLINQIENVMKKRGIKKIQILKLIFSETKISQSHRKK